MPAEGSPSAGAELAQALELGEQIDQVLELHQLSDRELLERAFLEAKAAREAAENALTIAKALAQVVEAIGPVAEQLAAGGPLGLVKLLTGRPD